MKPFEWQKHKEIILFLVVGFINTIFAFSLFTLFSLIGLAYPIAVLLSTCCGVVFNYFSTGKVVFAQCKGRLGYFLLTYSFTYLLNVGLIALFISFGCNRYEAYISALPIVTCISFTCFKRFVFLASPANP